MIFTQQIGSRKGYKVESKNSHLSFPIKISKNKNLN